MLGLWAVGAILPALMWMTNEKMMAATLFSCASPRRRMLYKATKE